MDIDPTPAPPAQPIRMLETERVAADTHVIRQLGGEGQAPAAVFLNSQVIVGEQPVIVDTGLAMTREPWMEAVFSLVEPTDVRWIFLSHDDGDHTGNLLPVLDACPNATLVLTAFMMERMMAEVGPLPMDRMRWVNDGDRIDAGDRELVALLPPTFDSPTTRGLFDTRSRVYWASDSLGNMVPHEIADISELEPGYWREQFVLQQQMVSPWLSWVDPARYAAGVDRIAALEAVAITSAHGATLRAGQVGSALNLTRELPHLPMAPAPGQDVLEAILAQLAAMGPGPAAGAPEDVAA